MSETFVMPPPKSPVMLSEVKARWLLSPLVVIVAGLLTWFALHEMRHVLHYALLLGLDAYGFMSVMYYWMSRSYKDGVTIREFWRCTFWPYGLARLVGSRKKGTRQQLYVADADHHHWLLDWHILPRTWQGVLAGIIVTLLALVITPLLMLWHLFHLFFSLIWLIMAAWIVCDALYYLGGRVWQGGVTRKELLATVFGGPFAVFVRAWRFARLRRHNPVPVMASSPQPNAV